MDWEKYFTSPSFLMGANLLANSTYDPMKQTTMGAFGTGLAGGVNSIAEIQKLRAAQNKDRKIVKGADGYNYYADTSERVLPDVQLKPTKENARFTNFQTGSDGNTYAFDRVEQTVVKLPGAVMPPKLGEGKDPYYNITTNPISGQRTGINRVTGKVEVIPGITTTPTQLPPVRQVAPNTQLLGKGNQVTYQAPPADYTMLPGQERVSGATGKIIRSKKPAPLRNTVMIDGRPGVLVNGTPYYGKPGGGLELAPEDAQITTIPRLQGGQDDLGLTTSQQGEIHMAGGKLNTALKQLDEAMIAVAGNPTSVGLPGAGKKYLNIALGTVDDLFDTNLYQDWGDPAADETRAKLQMLVGKLVTPITGDTSGRYSDRDMQRVEEAMQGLKTATHSRAVIQHLATIRDVIEMDRAHYESLLTGKPSNGEITVPGVGKIKVRKK